MANRHPTPVPPVPAGAGPGRAGSRFSSAFTIRVELEESAPPIWRTFRCPSDTRLNDLHTLLQTVIGWTNSHLHEFTPAVVPGRPRVVLFDPDDEYAEPEPGAVPETEVRLDQVIQSPGDTLEYLYDFGDSWHHTLTLETVTGRDPADRSVVCLGGERAAPPEDIGGIGFYNDLMSALRGPATWRDRDTTETLEATGLLGRDDVFDVDWTNTALARDFGARDALDVFLRLDKTQPVSAVLAGIMVRLGDPARQYLGGFLAGADLTCVPTPDDATRERATRVLRGLLDAVGDEGIVLTTAGYLTPATVASLMAVLDPAGVRIGGNNREVNIPALQVLRDAATALGLTRKVKGRLVLTAAGMKLRQNPAGLWAHIAARVPLERGDANRVIATLTILLTAAGVEPGTTRFLEELGMLVGMAGWVHHNGTVLDDWQLSSRAELTQSVLDWADTGTLIRDSHTTDTSTVTEDGGASVLLARTAFSR